MQLVLEGKAFVKKKNEPKKGVVGLDLGPSSIAIFSRKKAILKGFCEEIAPLSKTISKIQKSMDRKRRALNPDNYEADGTIKKGLLIWKLSKRYKKKKNNVSEENRKLKEHRKRLQGKLANEVCKYGNIIKVEKISVRGWQKLFGRSIARRAPALFLNYLRRKVENTGGKLIEL